MSSKTFRILSGLYIIGLIAGTFLDFRISQLLYDSGNRIGIFMNTAAMIPSWIIMLYSAGTVFRYCWQENNGYRYLAVLLPLIAGIASVQEIGQWLNMSDTAITLSGLMLGMADMVLFVLWKPSISHDRFIFAMMFLTAALLSFVSIESLKVIWGRRRYYTMEDPVTQFMVWYIPHPFGMTDFYRSFPSGHTGFSSLSMYLIFLPELTGFKISRKVLFGVSLLWIWTVMYSRICYGAHFLSDVSVGAMLGLTSCYITQKRLKKLIEQPENQVF